MTSQIQNDVVGCVLAGGLARRMNNADKAFLQLQGKPLLAYSLARLEPQVSQLIINANGDTKRFSRFEYPVVPDTVSGFAGPLAGVLAAMEWARDNQPYARWIASVAVDTPFFPDNLVTEMLRAVIADNAQMACAFSGDRHHPVFGLWPVDLADDLRRAMVVEEMRKVDLWTARYGLSVVKFDNTAFDPFFNINHFADIETASEILENIVT